MFEFKEIYFDENDGLIILKSNEGIVMIDVIKKTISFAKKRIQ